MVERGIVLDELNGRLSGYGLKFGPKPSTHSHCSLGGTIGNNSCGPRHSPTARPWTTCAVWRLEWFHDHVRIVELLFEGTLDPAGGAITPGITGTPGHGLTFRSSRRRGTGWPEGRGPDRAPPRAVVHLCACTTSSTTCLSSAALTSAAAKTA